jgi:hypothetical protein
MQNGEARIKQDSEELLIDIPSKKEWFKLIFYSFWLCGWFFGLILVISTYSLDLTSEEFGFTTFWLAGWISGGIFIIGFTFWGWVGKEIIFISGDDFFLNYTVLGYGFKHKLITSEVKDIRLAQTNNSFIATKSFSAFGFGKGKIHFDHGLKTYKLGHGLHDAEAKYIIDLLNKHIDNHQ